MPTPSTTISSNNIQTEFGGVNPIGLSEYYRGGSYVSNNVVGVASSGALAMSTLRNKSRVSISVSSTSINEGDSVTFTITAPTLNSTVVYWAAYTTTGTTAVDIVGDNPLGSFTVSSNTATVTLTAKLDTDTPETGEKLGIRLYYTQADRDAFTNYFADSGEVVTINNATYTVTPAANNVNEGGSLTINVATTNISNGTTLYWTINHTTTTSGDFSSNSGSFTITTNAGSFTVGPVSDQVTEGAESFTVSIRAYSTSGTVLATTSSITVNDTSTTPVPTYSATPAASSVNEGSSVTINVTTTNVVNSTTLYWTISHSTTAAADFSATSGSFTITSNAGSFTISAVADNTTEGAETFTVQIRTGSTAGTVVATSSSITVNDTSQTPSYTLTRSVASVNEGGSFSITFSTNQGGSFGYTITGVSSADIGGASLTGTVSNGSVLNYTATADNTTEGTEVFQISLDNGQTSTSVTINDTSQTPFYSLTRSVASVNEGGSFSVTFSTNQSGNFGYTITGVSSADIGGASLTGTFTYDGESRTYNVTADSTTEGTETFTMSLNNGQASSSVTINDTSLTPASYSLTRSTSAVNEGGSFTITFNTNQSGSFGYTISGVSSADIGGASLTGTFTYDGETRTYNVTADSTTEGTETFTMSLNNGQASTSVTINDTSLTPAAFDLVSISTTGNNTISAGDQYTITVTSNVSRGVDTKINLTFNQVYFRGNDSTDWTEGNITYTDLLTIPAGSTSGTFTGRLGPEQGTRTGTLTASAGTGAPALTSRSVSVSMTTNVGARITGVVVNTNTVTVVPTSSAIAGVINNNICWFNFIATASTSWTIDTNASSNISGLAAPDTRVAVYQISGGLCIAMNDDIGGGNYRSSVTVSLTGGQTYWVAVGYYGGWAPTPNSTTYWGTGTASITLSGLQQIKLSIAVGNTTSSPQ